MEFNKHMKTTELIEFLRAKNVRQEACELLAGKYNKKFGFVSNIKAFLSRFLNLDLHGKLYFLYKFFVWKML